jgi:hypothetical protein
VSGWSGESSTVEQLAERVRRLEATQEITVLRTEFHRSVNNREWSALGQLFTDDAHLDYGEYGQAHGSAGIQEYYIELLPKLAEFKHASEISLKNFMNGHQVRLQDETRASGVCFFEEKIRFDKENQAYSSVGQFTDKYVHQEGRWLFSTIKLKHFWVIPDNDGWQWPW